MHILAPHTYSVRLFSTSATIAIDVSQDGEFLPICDLQHVHRTNRGGASSNVGEVVLPPSDIFTLSFLDPLPADKVVNSGSTISVDEAEQARVRYFENLHKHLHEKDLTDTAALKEKIQVFTQAYKEHHSAGSTSASSGTTIGIEKLLMKDRKDIVVPFWKLIQDNTLSEVVLKIFE
jgi:hypothetical protein